MELADAFPDLPRYRVRREALTTLTDLLEWHLSADEWQVVARALENVAAAVDTGDDEALARQTAELEALSPFRIAPIDLAHPVPLSLRLRDNILIHRLTDAAARPVARQIAAPVPVPSGGAGVRQEFVVHAFAPMDGPWAEPAYQQVRRLWDRAAQVLAATAPLGDPGPPVDLRLEGLLAPFGPLLAARQRPDRTAQMVLRREHDALVLSIGWRAAPGVAAPGWAGGEDQWSAIARDDADELLGVARLRVGLVPPEGTGDLFAGELWESGGAALGRCTFWELPPFDDHGRWQRSLLVLAEESDEPALSKLVWSDGSPAMPPLARYLLDAAKVRYELRVRLAASTTLRSATQSLPELSTRLDDLRLTVGIARSNMAEVLRAVDPGGTPDGLFADDLGTAAWLDQILDDDLHYLGNAQERTRYRATYTATTAEPAVALVTAMPEEYAAMAELLDDAAERTIDGDDAPYLAGSLPSAGGGPPHSVVLTMLGGTGTIDAGANVAHLLRSFPSVREVLMVGITAGVPSPGNPGQHVRLGDIVVATWGVIDYDHVVDRPAGVSLRVSPPSPSYLLSRRAGMLEAGVLRFDSRPWEAELDRLIASLPAFDRPDADTDILYDSDAPDAQPIEHPTLDASGHRPGRPKVHLGRIGSANRSLRNARVRDELAARHGLRAVEMEGSGLAWAAYASARSWLVIGGISDYGDSRMGTQWRRYASAVAAAYTRALLGSCPTIEPAGRPSAQPAAERPGA
jgi:nucleoside phosphorylase